MEFIRRNVNASSTTYTGGSGGGYTGSSGSNGTLETHTIFSLPFNGTNDVKGDLADVDKITADGDISTGGNLILKGKDEEGSYNGLDLTIALEDKTQISGGKEYVFDGTVNAPLFDGNVDANNITTVALSSGITYAEELTAENATVVNLLSTNNFDATLAEVVKIISENIEVDNLTVKKAAHFFKLIIDEIKSVGGLLIISPANASLDKVVVSGSNYKCYFRAEADGKKIDNQFEVDDLVVCQTFNASEGLNYDSSNKFYWRLVIDKGTEELDGIDYHYIILSDSDKDIDSNGIPSDGDKVALLGNRTDTSRQNAIIISAYSSAYLDSSIEAPFIVQYSGVNNYNLSTHRNSIISNGKNLFTGDFVLTSGEDITGIISEIKATAKDISLFVLEPDKINMFEGSNGNNYGCWKVSGVSVSAKSGTDYILVLGGSNNGGYILQPSKYFVTTNKVNVSLEVSELLGLASYYSMEICDESGTVISNKVNLATGSKTYAFTLTKVPNSIIHLKISLITGSRLAFRNEKALLETVPKKISGIEVDIDSITSRVSDTEGLISTISQTVNQISSKVSGIEGSISEISQKADSIEAKIVTEDRINSIISQNTSNIKAEVYNELNESTGIDITTGTITLNADKTVFNGNINMRNSDEGLVVFDNKGNASVIIQNKQIPSLSNLNNSTHDYVSTSEFTQTSTNDFVSASQKIGTAKAGDTIIIEGGGFYFCYKNSSNNVYPIPLSSTSYLEYYYTLKNTTTGKTTNTTVQKLTATTEALGGGEISGNTFSITEDGNYEVVLYLKHCNPTTTYSTYHIVWGYYLDKNVSQYTLLGTNGIVSVQDQYKYLYFGNEGFEARMSNYNGFKVTRNKCQLVLADYNDKTLWGSLASKIEVVVNPKSTSMAVSAGGTSMGTKNVVRADADYYDDDMFVFNSLSAEVWVKLPTSLIVYNGANYYMSSGRVIKIRNLTSQKCYVYISDAGYKIYDVSGTSSASYLSIGTGSAEFVWDGFEWIRTA